MNRRLFWKIFLPFWVAQALLLGVLYLRLQHRAHADNPWWVQPERRLVPTLADLAVRRYEDQGQPALRALIGQRLNGQALHTRAVLLELQDL